MHGFRFGSRFLGLALVLPLGLSASCGGSAADPPKTPPPPPVSLSFPVVTIPPGVENTQCVVMRLGNAEPLHVGAIHNTLGEGSHHLIVYRVSDTEEKRTPFPCQPFTDTLDSTKGSPLIVTQKKDDLLELPPGVAYTLDANQMVRIEMHYINPSAKTEWITATTTMVPISDDDYRDDADFLFIGNPDIRVPPHQTATLGPTFFELPSELSGVSFFAITGHTHQYGTNVQVASVASAEDEGKMVYDVPGWQWAEPKTEVFATPFVVPDNGGFRFSCTWNNTSSTYLGFGESANDEMCFFWAYYYPSRGAKVCVHTKRAGNGSGLSLCCPGHPLCGAVNEYLSRQ